QAGRLTQQRHEIGDFVPLLRLSPWTAPTPLLPSRQRREKGLIVAVGLVDRLRRCRRARWAAGVEAPVLCVAVTEDNIDDRVVVELASVRCDPAVGDQYTAGDIASLAGVRAVTR